MAADQAGRCHCFVTTCWIRLPLINVPTQEIVLGVVLDFAALDNSQGSSLILRGCKPDRGTGACLDLLKNSGALFRDQHVQHLTYVACSFPYTPQVLHEQRFSERRLHGGRRIQAAAAKPVK